MVTYEDCNLKKQKATIKPEFRKTIERAQETGFPNCKGLYPDCPEKPSKEHPMCRNCPVLDEE